VFVLHGGNRLLAAAVQPRPCMLHGNSISQSFKTTFTIMY